MWNLNIIKNFDMTTFLRFICSSINDSHNYFSWCLKAAKHINKNRMLWFKKCNSFSQDKITPYAWVIQLFWREVLRENQITVLYWVLYSKHLKLLIIIITISCIWSSELFHLEHNHLMASNNIRSTLNQRHSYCVSLYRVVIFSSLHCFSCITSISLKLWV